MLHFERKWKPIKQDIINSNNQNPSTIHKRKNCIYFGQIIKIINEKKHYTIIYS